jgi:hypothetical protein
MSKLPENMRSKVVLTAFGREGVVVEQHVIDYDDFYGETNSLIDDADRIKTEQIHAITGEVFDSSGKIQSSFVNFYNRNGLYARSRTIHSNGKVIQD